MSITLETPRILLYPDPLLRRPAKEVDKVDKLVDEKINKLLDVMTSSGGQGLAAPQVGWGDRILVMNLTDDPDNSTVLINPEIVEMSKEKEDAEEGCLSFPGIFVTVSRSKEIMIKALDRKGAALEKTYTDWQARVIQHEVDHMDGILFIDYLSPAKKLKFKKQLRALKKYYKSTRKN